MGVLAELVAGPPPGTRDSRGGSAVSMIFNPGGMSQGGPMDVEAGLRLTTAWACVRLIAQVSGTLPLRVIRKDDRRRKAVEEPAFRYLWGPPNTAMHQPTYWSQQVLSSLTYGNPVAWKGRADGARLNPERPWEGITELWPMHPRDVKIGRAPDWSKVFQIAGERSADGQPVVRTVSEVAHVPYLTQDGYVGMSPLQQNAATLAVASGTQRSSRNLLEKGLQTPGILTTEQEISQEDADAISDLWMARHSGQSTAGRPVVLGKGTKFERLTLSPVDAQLLQMEVFTREQIPTIYGVPPHMIGIVSKSTSWGTGIEQQFIGFVVTVVLPLLVGFEKTYGAECLPDEFELKFSLQALLRGDMKTRAEFYRTLRMIGAMSADTILELEDLPPRGIPDDYLSPTNMTRLTVGGAEPEVEAGPLSASSRPSAPMLAEARCGCGALLAKNLTGSADLWCVKCKAVRTFGAQAPAALMMAEQAGGSLPRDGQDMMSQVAEIVAERLI